MNFVVTDGETVVATRYVTRLDVIDGNYNIHKRN